MPDCLDACCIAPLGGAAAGAPGCATCPSLCSGSRRLSGRPPSGCCHSHSHRRQCLLGRDAHTAAPAGCNCCCRAGQPVGAARAAKHDGALAASASCAGAAEQRVLHLPPLPQHYTPAASTGSGAGSQPSSQTCSQAVLHCRPSPCHPRASQTAPCCSKWPHFKPQHPADAQSQSRQPYTRLPKLPTCWPC